MEGDMGIRRMISGWLLGAMGLALANVGLAGDQIGSTDPIPAKHYTKEPSFHLPISIQDKMRSSIREVQLFMKVGGGEWQRKEIAPASQRAFTFKAPGDGEYWFTLVTVDTKGMALPADLSRLSPSEIVMVVVDTQAPMFELKPVKMASGEVLLRCIVSDANPDPMSVKISFRGTDQGLRALEPQPGMPGNFRIPGPEVLVNPLHVTVSDLAGNMTTRDVSLQENVAKLWPAAPQTASNQPPAPMPQPQGPQQVPVASPGAVTSQSSPVVPRMPEQNPIVSSQGAMQSGMVPAAQPPLVPSLEQRYTPQPAMPPPSTPQSAAPPAQVQSGSVPRQFINTTRASLDYRVDQVGPSGVGRVDVWVTSDQGASWKRHCEDADRRSPAEFDLPGDGLYGVRVVLTNGNGFGGRQPAPGEQPQLWIEVDTVAPTVQLKDVEPSSNGTTLDLRWLVSDKNLGSEPINLYYSTHREGPWQPVVRGVKNDGLYHWTYPHDVGPQFYVRLEAVDMAGNLTRCETPNAIVLDMTEPRASIVGVSGVQAVIPAGGR
jgi:hypothetical protein